ncbi:protocatechuate 3,4-dioxygenase [Actinoplanes aureus]|uniref:Protocatechuate 3,4-dioxygenase n=1 Tax=Actinoplanes aureus TaxID=2792083 RepID=A0A931FWT5_9ACTN|nr:protocatechuate 3,4-dioxygenase [Actinoplanes aureus]MBG0562092.1 protocatechuate 3,4-dioxygenase [Actinoplanes aureus]
MRDDETGGPVITRLQTTLPGARRTEFPPRPSLAYTFLLVPAGTGGSQRLPLELVRRDIAGDHPGLPLMLRIRVLDALNGDPVTRAVVDIRHCAPDGETVLRGAQTTDPQGYAEFRTVHPGWLPGQAVHLRAEVHLGGYLAGGRSIAHTGRLYFPETLTAQVAGLPPYRDLGVARTANDDDPELTGGGMLNVVPRDRYDLTCGLLAGITAGIATTAG